MPVEELREPLPRGERFGSDQVRHPPEPSGEDSTAETPGRHPQEPEPAGDGDEPVRVEPVADWAEPVASERIEAELNEGGAVASEWVGARPAESGHLESGPAVSESAVNGPVEERVRQQVASLSGIENRPLAEHAQRYDEVHAELQAALTEIDGESGG